MPIVTSDHMRTLKTEVDQLNERVKKNSYMPEIGHGFLGLQKGHGVTRFLPILTKEDMAVYYQLCGQIGDAVLKKRDGVYGGWHSVPISQRTKSLAGHKKAEENAAAFQQNYATNSFSDFLWLKEFRSFTELISKLTATPEFGNYVIQTDIANFYDSIEVPKLIKRLRAENFEIEASIEMLEMFLGTWNRRTTGYHNSSKGIPQEIISDASRILSHYYLQDFDEKFSSYCDSERLKYVRWADDMLVFGSSKKKLEVAVHRASKFLLSDGLNLNAPKTRIFARTDYAKYRGLGVLSAIDSGQPEKFRRELRASINWGKSNPFRLDTIFRATIGYIFNLGKAAKTFERNFVFETVIAEPDLVGTLNVTQLFRLISIADNPKEMFVLVRKIVLDKPFAGPRANFLMLIRNKSDGLAKLGITKYLQQSSISMIKTASPDSEILNEYCVPRTIATLE